MVWLQQKSVVAHAAMMLCTKSMPACVTPHKLCGRSMHTHLKANASKQASDKLRLNRTAEGNASVDHASLSQQHADLTVMPAVQGCVLQLPIAH